MSDLHDRICQIALEWEGNDEPSIAWIADRILALPEIAEALASQACACGEKATCHECTSCSAFNNTCV